MRSELTYFLFMKPIQRYLDAAILKPEFTQDEVIQAIQACVRLGTYSVCVRPCDIGLAREYCRGTQTLVCVVLGFPHGDQLPASKVDEAKRYLELGVDEIDMVANYGWIRSGCWKEVENDVAGVAECTRAAGIPLKVIFETARLDGAQIRRMTEVCLAVGADFVKTSTGFNGDGASDEAVRIMLDASLGRMQVKPSGGIRTREDAERFVRMGAHRLGVGWGSCEAICEGADPKGDNAY
jgi:deoxyribose-phosphate aldolase